MQQVGLPGQFIGASPAIRELQEEIGRVAASDAKVLITGESGTGKEVVARAIAMSPARVGGTFVPVNCAGIAETLLESELFGHAKGSFTGAYRDKPGKFEMASNGTLFLDEIGEMSLRMQGLLLRVLETGEIQKVGAERVTTAENVRIIAATNRDLWDLIARGHFREDLFYRLNVIHLTIPPLRERREDIPLLVDHFLQRFTARNGYRNGAITAHDGRATVTDTRVGTGTATVVATAISPAVAMATVWRPGQRYRGNGSTQPRSRPVDCRRSDGGTVPLQLARQRSPGGERHRAGGGHGSERGRAARGAAARNPPACVARAADRSGAETDEGRRPVQEADRGARVVLDRGLSALYEPRNRPGPTPRSGAQGARGGAGELQDRASSLQHGNH